MQMWSKGSGAERIMSENADTKEMSESMAVKTIDGNTVSNDKTLPKQRHSFRVPLAFFIDMSNY